jgi:hypothetical protein
MSTLPKGALFLATIPFWERPSLMSTSRIKAAKINPVAGTELGSNAFNRVTGKSPTSRENPSSSR